MLQSSVQGHSQTTLKEGGTHFKGFFYIKMKLEHLFQNIIFFFKNRKKFIKKFLKSKTARNGFKNCKPNNANPKFNQNVQFGHYG